MSCIVPLNFVQIKKAFRLPWVEIKRGLIAQGVSPAALLTFAARECFGVEVCPGVWEGWQYPGLHALHAHGTSSVRSTEDAAKHPPGDKMLLVGSHGHGFHVQS